MTIIKAGLRPDWRQNLIEWATGNDAVTEMWIFGSRGPKALADDSRDLDIGITLVPAIGNDNWALGNYWALGDGWQAELADIVGRKVSLQAMVPGNKGDVEIRSTGVCIWRRAL
jgi:hypothetical protein